MEFNKKKTIQTTGTQDKRVRVQSIYDAVGSLFCPHAPYVDKTIVNGEKSSFRIALCESCFNALKVMVNSVGA